VTRAEHQEIVIPWLADDDARAEYVRSVCSGVSHRRALFPRAPQPDEPVTVELTAGPACLDRDAWVEADGERRTLGLVGSQWNTLLAGYVRRYRGQLPGRPHGSVVAYRLGVGGEEADGGIRHAYAVLETRPVAWAADAIVYQVWVDRFWSGSDTQWPSDGSAPADRYGGTLGGLRERLDYISELGANTIWLNPIYPSGSYHGYDVTDYFGVDPNIGTLDEFDALVADVHGRGMRLVLDFVASHVSNAHPTFLAAQTERRSTYADWYRFAEWPGAYDTFFGVETMPSLNHEHEPVREHLVGAASFWVERGVDGLRLDYALGPSPQFWAELRVAVKSRFPDCWLFGEVVETPETQLQYEGLLDGCLDFALVEALRSTFAYGSTSLVEFAAFLEAHELSFPPAWSRPAFLDNHDLNRFLFAAGGERRRLILAALCLFTLPGPPLLYYGTEAGLSQSYGVKDTTVWGGDRHARLPMPWGDDQDTDLVRVFRALAQLRASEPALRRESTRVLDADESTLRYARGPLIVTLDASSGSGWVSDGGRDVFRVP
jgi:glycosidase